MRSLKNIGKIKDQPALTEASAMSHKTWKKNQKQKKQCVGPASIFVVRMFR